MFTRIVAIAAATMAFCAPALAQGCAFQVSGTPMLTPMIYKATGGVGRVGPAQALDNLARAVAADGFANIRVDKQLGAVDAMQEMSGSGRPQFVRFVVRKQGGGVRVDATFRIQAGQVSPEEAVRSTLCRIISEAAG